MFGLPGFDEGDGQQEVRIRVALGRAVDHHGRGDEFVRINRVDCIVGQVFAGDPMDRGIEMRARVLAGREVVPIPGRPALVIARDFFQASAPRKRAESRWVADSARGTRVRFKPRRPSRFAMRVGALAIAYAKRAAIKMPQTSTAMRSACVCRLIPLLGSQISDGFIRCPR